MPKKGNLRTTRVPRKPTRSSSKGAKQGIQKRGGYGNTKNKRGY